MYYEGVEQENVTVTSMNESESTTRTNRTNRLEVLEEYYENSTNDDQFEATTAVEFKEIVVLFANASVNEDLNRTNVTIVEEIGKRKQEFQFVY
jgi:hypothetical protein